MPRWPNLHSISISTIYTLEGFDGDIDNHLSVQLTLILGQKAYLIEEEAVDRVGAFYFTSLFYPL